MKKLLYLTILAFVFAGCKKDDDTTPTGPTLSGYSVSFEIAGTKYTYSDGVGGYKNACSSSIPSGSPAGVFSTFTKDASVSAEPKSMTIGMMGLTFGGTTCDNGTFAGFFSTGSRIYYGSMSSAGAIINFYDETGKFHSTSGGSQGTQSFNISKSVERKVGSKYYRDVTGTFTCMLYPSSGPGLQAINGKFTATFLNE